MNTNPIHGFEIAGAKGGGIMGLFGGGAKPQLGIHDKGLSWPEGKEKIFVDFTQITDLKFSKYYSTVSITHKAMGSPQTKKVTLANVGMFETIWTDFARRQNLTIKLKSE
jgi:hypothetical protein